MRDSTLKMWILSALFAAIIAVCSQISFNLTPQVPFTMQTFAIALTAILLGSRYGTLAVAIYLLLGAVGFPVFANMKGGFQVLVGPTAGYLISYAISAFLIGKMVGKGKLSIVRSIAASILGLIIIYTLGTCVLKLTTQMTWTKSLMVGTIPFIIPDLIKIIIASWLGVTVRKRLEKTGLMTYQMKSSS